jgi:hypothetical protein
MSYIPGIYSYRRQTIVKRLRGSNFEIQEVRVVQYLCYELFDEF